MPKLNVGRSVGVETNLAARIAHERNLRGQSYEVLAEAMTQAGCAINGSSIYKIEHGSPPRRISVDELWTLAQVWGTTVEDLLTPMELLEQRRAHELIESIQEVQRGMGDLASDAFNAFSELIRLAFEHEELYEYVVNQLAASAGGSYTLRVGGDSEDPEWQSMETLTVMRLTKANQEHWRELQKATLMWESFKAGRWTNEDDSRAEALLAELRAELKGIAEEVED